LREEKTMPAKNPRINVVLEPALYRKVQLLAQRDGVSLSSKVRDLVIEALEIQEDVYLAQFAEEREASWDSSSALAHEEVWP